MSRIRSKTVVGMLALVGLIALGVPMPAAAQEAPCPLPDDPSVLLDAVWPLVDTNGDGGISFGEIQVVYPLDQYMFDVVDMDHNGLVTRDELIVILPLLESYIGGGLLGMIDLNGDQLIQYSEVSDYVTPEQFAAVDLNGNGVIDCEDVGAPPPPPPPVEGEGEGEEEGESEGEVGALPCPLPDDNAALVMIAWPVVDTNGDGGISLEEFLAMMPDILVMPISPEQIFAMVDADGDGLVSFEELMAFEPTIFSLLGESLLAAIDVNGNGLIEYAEVGDYLTPGQFAQMDLNGNGVIDCEDIVGSPPPPPPPPVEGEGEGEEEGEPSGLPCPLPDDLVLLAEFILPVVDLDGDGGLSAAEIRAVYPEIDGVLADLGISLDMVFAIADANGDGSLTIEEVMPFLGMVGPDISVLEYVDLNGDGVIAYAELAGYASPEQFAALDVNGNGVLDCEDMGLEPPPPPPPPPVEGEGEGEYELPCPIPLDPALILELLWPIVDANGDGGISLAEVQAFVPEVDASMFALVDMNGDGLVMRDEIMVFVPLVLDMLMMEVDPSGDGVIAYGEVAAYVTPEQFALLDVNADGVIDCYDFNGLGPIEGEGEDPEGPCPLPNDPAALAGLVWPIVDTDGNGGLSLAEVLAFYPPFPAEYFPMVDQNGDGEVTIDELFWIMPLIPIDYLAYVDLNGNDLLEFEEVSEWISQEQFDGIDLNDNGVLDCEDLGDPPSPPVEGEGEEPGPSIPWDILQMLLDMFPIIDVNGDGVLSILEIELFFPVSSDLLGCLDWEGDWTISREDIEALVNGGSFGQDTILGLRRLVGGNNFYVPGESLIVRTTVDMLVPGPVSALGLSETLPAGWALEEVVDAVGAEAVPEPGDSTLEFAWLIMPRFPVRVVYRVAVPGDAGGPQAIIGEALYRTPDSLELSTGILATAVGDAPGGLAPHSVDSNLDWTISLSEILRVIQFFNMDGYQCADGTEDGYAPGLGAIGCLPHTGDYLEQDWAIDLSELLRMVQLFNAPAGAYYVDVAGEDGFSPGLFTLN